MKKCAIDPNHSVATFAVRHMMLANERGMRNKIRGTILYDEGDISRSSVEAEIEVASLMSGKDRPGGFRRDVGKRPHPRRRAHDQQEGGDHTGRGSGPAGRRKQSQVIRAAFLG